MITLLDLKNAFGEVHHDLIQTALQYHHLPDLFTHLFNSIYQGAVTSVTSNKEWTEFIKVEKGVLQGDPGSPLLFNLCFNLLMQVLTKPELKTWDTFGVQNMQHSNPPGSSSQMMRRSFQTVQETLRGRSTIT